MDQGKYDPAAVVPASTGDVIGSAGEPVTVTITSPEIGKDGTPVEKGGTPVLKEWKVGYPTQAAKDRYEKYVLAYEQRVVRQQKELLDHDEYSARVDRLAEQVLGRAYATGGAVWLKHSARPHGWVMWFRSLLAEHHPSVTDEDVKAVMAGEPEQVRLALAVVVPPFVAWVVRQLVAVVEAAGDPETKVKVGEAVVKMRAEMAKSYPHISLDRLTPSA